MQKLISLILFIALLTGVKSYATLMVAEPSSLGEMVLSSQLIVKGTMKPIAAFGFWGYNEDGSLATIEQRMEEINAPREIIEAIGGRTVDFEITVSEHMKGERQTKEPIIVRISMPQLTKYYEETPEKERIFFLSSNHPNVNSYGSMTVSGILDETPDGRYVYPDLSDDLESITHLITPAYIGQDDARVEVFDSLVRQRVAAQR